jgi:VIT1/CCC1 family predicted Fe2+/Mn2+ transporter
MSAVVWKRDSRRKSRASAFSALLGVVSARAGDAPVLMAAWRVTFWAGLAMAITFSVGWLFGVAA